MHSGHTDHILALAISSDGQLLASGGRDTLLHLWDTRTHSLLHTFKKHKAAVSAIAFRKNTHTLYSASHDLSLHIWNCDEMGYVDTLIGHNDWITGIDVLSRECCITAGGRDRTVQLWKIADAKRVEYRARGHGSIDCISYINDEFWVTGSDDGSLALWHTMRKKQVDVVENAHSGQWISAVTTMPYTDLIASGACDGTVKLWRVDEHKKKLVAVASIPCTGFVNALRFSSDVLLAGVGQEHRLGRWSVDRSVRNGLCVLPLCLSQGD